MAQQTKKQEQPKNGKVIEEQDNKKEKMIKLGVIFAFIIVLIILLVTFCHRKDYAVTFMVDGKEYRLENVHNMGEIVKPKEPTKEGYTFTGWYVGDKEFDFENGDITENMQLEAHFTLNVYTVTISDGLGNTEEFEIEHGKKLDEPEAPTKKGYAFLGWYLEDEKYDFEEDVTSNMQLEARFKEKGNASYTVEYYLMGLDGKYPNKASEKTTNEAQIDSEITPTVKSFKGFKSPKGETITVLEDGSAKVKYYYSRNKYSLTLEGDQGIADIEGEGTYYYDEKVNVSVTLKDGYEFAGWSSKVEKNTFTMPANKTTLTAKTKPIEYTVKYNLNGGNGEYPSTYNVENPLELENPTKVGYTFKHWLANGEEVETLEGLLGNLELEAIFEANTNTTYKVEHYYMDKEGNYPKTTEIVDTHEGTTDTSAIQESDRKVPEVGFTFDSEVSTSGVNIDGNGTTVVKYYYKRNQHTLTVSGDVGIKAPAKTSKEKYYYEEEVQLDSKDAAYVEGYEFDYWLVDNAVVKGDTLTLSMGDSDVSVTMITKKVIYTLTYISETDQAKPEEYTDTFVLGDKKEAHTPKPWIGHTFKGWYEDLESDEPFDFETPMKAGDLTLYAKWEVDTNTIAFVTNKEGLTIAPIIADYGTSLMDKWPKDPTYDGYTFEGWYSDRSLQTKATIPDTMPATGMTLYAKWRANKYTITFDQNGGEGETVTQTLTYDQAETPLTANTYTKTGYHFTGWSTSSDGNKEYDNQAEVQNLAGKKQDDDTITLYAMWEANEYEVKYDSNGGIGDMPNSYHTYDKDSALSDNTFTKEGYHFLGWTKDTKTNELIQDTKNYTDEGTITVYAVWQANTYTVTFKANKGIGEDKTQSFTYDAPKTPLTENTFTREGYTFDGWSTSPDGNKIYDNQAEVQNLAGKSKDKDTITLYAHWVTVDYTITYKDELNAGGNNNQTSYNIESDPITLSSLTKTGYTFLGWYETNGDVVTDKKVESIPTGSYGNLTLTAKWREHTYNVVYTDGNSSTQPVEKNYTDKFNLEDSSKYTKNWKVTYNYHHDDVENKEVDRPLSYQNWKVKDSSDTTYKVGTEVSMLTAEDGATITLEPVWENPTISDSALEVPARKGYNFTEWQLDGKPVTNTDKVTKDITLTAQWTAKKYTVTYESNNGKSETVTDTFTFDGENITKPANTFTKSYQVTWTDGVNKDSTTTLNATLTGWKVKDSSDGTCYDPDKDIQNQLSETGENDVTLVACWQDPTITHPTDERKKTGYKFGGWYTDVSQEDTKIEDKSKVSSDLTLNAKWTPITYTIKYKFDQNEETEIITYSESQVKLKGSNTFTKTYKITFDVKDGSSIGEKTYKATLTKWKVISGNNVNTEYNVGDRVNQLTTTDGDVIELEAVWDDPKVDLTQITTTKKGYTFQQWKNGDNKQDNSFTLSSDLKLTADWKAITYQVKYNGTKTKTCTYDLDCDLDDYNNVEDSITVTLHNGDQTVPVTKTEKVKAVCKTSTGGSCEQDATINATDSNVTVKNLASTQDAEVTVKSGIKVTFPEVQKADCVFGGWSKNQQLTNDKDNIIGYHLLKDEEAEFTGQYTYATEYEFIESTNLYAKWWAIPYISGATFNLVNLEDETITEAAEIKTGHLPGTTKTTFYVKMPIKEGYYVDIFSLQVSVSQPVVLNTKATQIGGDIYSYPIEPDDVPALGIGSLPTEIPFLPDSTNKNFATDKETTPPEGNILSLFEMLKENLNSLAFAALVNQFFGDLGVANQFGCNGLACSPHYASKLYYNINGSVYYFFGTDDAMEDIYTIEYWTGEELAYSIEVPHGSVIPDLGKDVTIYKVININQPIEEGNSYTVSGWETSDGKEVTFSDSSLADESNPAYKLEDEKKKIILKAKDAQLVQKDA